MYSHTDLLFGVGRAFFNYRIRRTNMKFFEFGKEHKKLMVLLHGGGVSYLGILPTAE